VTDRNGASDLGVVNLLINDFIDGRQACYLAYVPATATLLLVSDAGSAGGPYAGSTKLTGSMSTIQNSQCAAAGWGSGAASSGNTLTLTLSVWFNAPFAGNRIVYATVSSTRPRAIEPKPTTPAGGLGNVDGAVG
jgi:hypothetical protein